MARKLRVEYPGAVQTTQAGSGAAAISVEQLAGVSQAPGPAVGVVAGLPAGRQVDRLLGEYRIPQGSAAGQRSLEAALEERRAAEAGADYKPVRRGWCVWEDTLRQELLGQMKERLGAEHYGAERAETLAAQAAGLVAEELKRPRWTEAELGRRAKGGAGQVVMAVRLRAETAVTVKWIAERLQMGAPVYVKHFLHRQWIAEGN